MTGLPKFFEQTSDGLYDRHDYRVVAQGGDSVIVNDYMSAQEIWWNKKAFLSHIDVLDKKQIKKKSTKGFA